MPLVSDVPEQAPNPAVPLTRRERRANARTVTPTLPRRALLPRPLAIAATMAFAALVALTGYASPQFVALAVALGGLVLAWGWPLLLSLPSPRGTSGVLAIGTVLMTGTALATREEPYLQWMPAALAVSVIVGFLHQLMRRDGRPRLTESVAATTSGLAIIAAGTALAPIPHVLAGEHALAATMAGLGVGVLADPFVSVRALRQWALFISMILGGGAALLVSLAAGEPMLGPAGLLGLLAAAISHAARRVLAPLPATAMPRAQLAVAASSSLLVGVVAYVVVRYFVA